MSSVVLPEPVPPATTKKYRTENYRHSDKNRPDQHELNRRIRGIKAAELPEHLQKFRSDISAILISIIETNDEEPEEPYILGESSLPFDAETNKTFKILKDYYINGYEISHINKRFNYTDETQENRRQVNYQLKIGRKKLYQIYKERSQNNGNQQAD